MSPVTLQLSIGILMLQVATSLQVIIASRSLSEYAIDKIVFKYVFKSRLSLNRIVFFSYYMKLKQLQRHVACDHNVTKEKKKTQQPTRKPIVQNILVMYVCVFSVCQSVAVDVF